MKGGSSPSRHDKLLDKDELKVDLDSFSHHGDYSNIPIFLIFKSLTKCDNSIHRFK